MFALLLSPRLALLSLALSAYWGPLALAAAQQQGDVPTELEIDPDEIESAMARFGSVRVREAESASDERAEPLEIATDGDFQRLIMEAGHCWAVLFVSHPHRRDPEEGAHWLPGSLARRDPNEEGAHWQALWVRSVVDKVPGLSFATADMDGVAGFASKRVASGGAHDSALKSRLAHALTSPPLTSPPLGCRPRAQARST